jgi:hypothetical protein
LFIGEKNNNKRYEINDDEKHGYSLSLWNQTTTTMSNCATCGHCNVVLQEQKNNDEHGVGISVSCWCRLSMVLTLEFYFLGVYNFFFLLCLC